MWSIICWPLHGKGRRVPVRGGAIGFFMLVVNFCPKQEPEEQKEPAVENVATPAPTGETDFFE